MPPWAPGYAPDSIKGDIQAGLILENPVQVSGKPAAPDMGWSWIYMALSLLFFIVAIRVKGSPRYFLAMLNDMTDTRERQNVFDDTVKETSFLILVNLLWAGCAGIIIAASFLLIPGGAGNSFTPPPFTPASIGICVGVVVAYIVSMLMAYYVVGNVFTNSKKTGMWIRGAAATNGLGTIILFPLALLALVQPDWVYYLLIIAATTFLIGKFIFILKGFRIFFTKIASWLLFLYYLCSLEIIPLLLAYISTMYLCSL